MSIDHGPLGLIYVGIVRLAGAGDFREVGAAATETFGYGMAPGRAQFRARGDHRQHCGGTARRRGNDADSGPLAISTHRPHRNRTERPAAGRDTGIACRVI